MVMIKRGEMRQRLTNRCQVVFHTLMKLNTLTMSLIIFSFSLIPPAEVYAEANAVPLNTLAVDASPQSSGMRISPETIAAMMRKIHYAKEGFFTSDTVIQVFRKYEIPDLSNEISAVSTELKPRHAIAFKTDGARVRGYIFLSARQAVWHIASIDGRPAQRITNLMEENASLDDSVSLWENRIEESYWQFTPRQGQTLYRDRPDWLIVPLKHVTEAKITEKPRRTKLNFSSPAVTNKSSHLSRIEILHRLMSKGLITQADYKGKVLAIIAEYEAANPDIEQRLGLLLQLKEKRWINEGYYQTRKRELLKDL